MNLSSLWPSPICSIFLSAQDDTEDRLGTQLVGFPFSDVDSNAKDIALFL